MLHTLTSVHVQAESQYGHVFKLISTIIKQKYPNFNDAVVPEVPFDDLLDWELWPSFLKIFCKPK